jgi:hypothetical protein
VAFDLDYLSTEDGEKLGAIWPDPNPAKIGHSHTLQRKRIVLHPSPPFTYIVAVR